MYLALKEKSDCMTGPAVNFYVVNITVPVLIVGLNIGLIFSQIIPFLYISILAFIISGLFMFVGIVYLKDIRASEKISDGSFRRLLPSRRQSPKKFNVTIQMAAIQ